MPSNPIPSIAPAPAPQPSAQVRATGDPTRQRARRRHQRNRPTWLTVAILGFAGMVGSFMHSLLIPIQAELPALLDASRGETAWVITITILVSCVCTPITGRLGDMYGKRLIILILLSLLTVGSVLCAVTTGVIPMLIGRGLQGMGMGVIPLGIALLRDAVPAPKLGSAIALVSATMGVGAAVGLPVAALITSVGHWRLLFIVATALSIAALALCAAFLPPSLPGVGGRVDVLGVIGLATWLTALLLVLSKGNEWGWMSPWIIGCAVCAAIVLVMWGWFEWRRSEPLVDVRVSLRAPVLLTNIASTAMGFSMFVPSIAFPQILALPTASGGVGLPLLIAGLVLMPSGLAMLAMSPIAGRMIDRFGPKPLLVVGSVTLLAAYLLALALPTAGWSIAIVMTVVGVGIGLGYAAMPALIMRAVPQQETAAANGLNTLVRALGVAVASAIVAGVLAHSAGTSATGDPTPAGFHLTLLLGAASAVISVALSIAVPGRATAPDAEPQPDSLRTSG